MKPAFYILYSEGSDKYYVGHTTEPIEERLRKHNTSHSGYTARLRPWKVVRIEYYETKEAAYKREREVKGWKSRRRIIELLAD